MQEREQSVPAQMPPPDQATRQFHEIASLYDVLMTGVPYAGWVAYVRKLLNVRSANPRNALDLACGTGNVTEQLYDDGLEVTGVDIAPHMIAEALRKARATRRDIRYYVQDAAELDLPGLQFDLCVSLFDSLNYVIDPGRLEAAMERVAAHLTRNGLFIFDLNSDFALRNRFFDQTNLASSEPLRYRWVSEYFSETRLCRVSMEFWRSEPDGSETEMHEEHWQFAYRADEIVEMLGRAGFDEISTYQAYTLRSPGRTADRIYYVARKP